MGLHRVTYTGLHRVISGLHRIVRGYVGSIYG